VTYPQRSALSEFDLDRDMSVPAGAAVDSVHVGRQTVYDGGGAVFGYQLLFRSTRDGSCFEDPEQVTSQVLAATFLEIGVEKLVGDRPVFVNLTRPFLDGVLPVAASPDQVVLEVGDGIAADGGLVAAAGRLAAQGFRIAVAGNARWDHSDALLDLAEYVKVDVSATSLADLPGVVADIRSHRAHPFADRVDSEELFTAAYQAGFELFQGQAFARPHLVGGPGLSPSRISCVRMLGAMLADEVDVDELENIIRTDPALAYRVLRLANSASIGLRRQVTSVRQALVLVGPEKLRGWFVLMGLTDMGVSDNERLGWALTRARMCELLAEHVHGASKEQAFLAGLLSSLATLLDMDVVELAEQVGAADALMGALEHGHGPLGRIVTDAISYEEGDSVGPNSTLDVVTARRAYLSAMAWSLQLCTITVPENDG
jgi:EAL and modified HD-GYP domain-containing signal transduction protein